MYYDLCNGSVTVNPEFACDENLTREVMLESEWPLERVVSTLVPVFFGIIGLAGLLGNALVVLGKNLLWILYMWEFIFVCTFAAIKIISNFWSQCQRIVMNGIEVFFNVYYRNACQDNAGPKRRKIKG